MRLLLDAPLAVQRIDNDHSGIGPAALGAAEAVRGNGIGSERLTPRTVEQVLGGNVARFMPQLLDGHPLRDGRRTHSGVHSRNGDAEDQRQRRKEREISCHNASYRIFQMRLARMSWGEPCRLASRT